MPYLNGPASLSAFSNLECDLLIPLLDNLEFSRLAFKVSLP